MELGQDETRTFNNYFTFYNSQGERIDSDSVSPPLNEEVGALTYITFINGECHWIDGDKLCDYGRYVFIPGADLTYVEGSDSITGEKVVVIEGERIELNDENVIWTEGKWMDINVENVVRTENGWVKKYVDYTVWVPGKYEKIQ